jgi:outer membrane protein assembly factor BamD
MSGHVGNSLNLSVPIMQILNSSRRSLWPLLVLLIIAMAFTTGCSRETREDDRGAEELYAEAQRALNAKSYDRAIEAYRQLTIRYPFGRHAEQSQLDMAYAMYRVGQSERALTTLDRFIRTYPTHPNVDYAWYLKGLVHYEDAMGFLRRLFPDQVKDRDQQSARSSFSDFRELIRRYPQSRYVADARQRMVFLRNVMADYEMEVGEYYYRRGAYVASLDRAKYIIENYPGAPANVDALELMERAYKRLDLEELAQDTRRVLEHNYPDLVDQNEKEGFFGRLWPFD